MAALARLTAALALLGLLASARPSGDGRVDLGELRRELAARRAAARAELEPAVARLYDRLAALEEEGRAGLEPVELEARREALAAELAALPLEAAPLLVEYLDGAGESVRSRATYEALRTLGTRGVTEELAALARSAEPATQRRAVRLLAASDDRRGAGAALRELWASPPGGLAGELARGLLLLGGAANRAAVEVDLAGDDRQRRARALESFAEVRPPGTAELVEEFLDRGRGVLENVPAIVTFYRAEPEAFEEAPASALVRQLLRAPEASPALRTGLAALPELKRRAKPSWLEPLRDAAVGATGERLELLLVCLARCGDRAARRRLLAEPTEWIERNKNNARAYRERGRLLLAIADYAKAAEDYEAALELTRFPATLRLETGIELARAHVLGGRLRQAAAVLEDLELSAVDLRRLDQDPDFDVLREHSRYGKVLR